MKSFGRLNENENFRCGTCPLEDMEEMLLPHAGIDLQSEMRTVLTCLAKFKMREINSSFSSSFVGTCDHIDE